jgi:hypothetical protein
MQFFSESKFIRKHLHFLMVLVTQKSGVVFEILQVEIMKFLKKYLQNFQK